MKAGSRKKTSTARRSMTATMTATTSDTIPTSMRVAIRKATIPASKTPTMAATTMTMASR